MTEDVNKENGKRDRSPSFPYISLEKALERIGVIFEKAKRHEVRIADIAKDWGLTPKSSSTDRNVAALLAYGLIEDNGVGDNRKIKISESGLRILDDERPGVKEELLSEAAIKPRIIGEYANRWADGRPDDTHALSLLKYEGKFTDEGARLFLRVFDETIIYLKPQNTNDLRSTTNKPDSVTPAPLPADIHQAAETAPLVKKNPAAIQRDVFSLDEGVVTIEYPEGLTVDSVEELEDFFKLFIKKARRRAT